MNIEQTVNDEVAILLGRLLIEKITFQIQISNQQIKIKELEDIIDSHQNRIVADNLAKTATAPISDLGPDGLPLKMPRSMRPRMEAN